MNTENLLPRMVRAARLNAAFYNEVEADTSLNGQALLVVIIAAVASGLGGLLGGLFGGAGLTAGITALIVGILLTVLGYYIWAYLTLLIGTRLFGGTADLGEMLRVIGYANTPNVLGFFSFIPILGGLIALVGSLWALVAGVIAVREALDFDTGKALLTVLIGWLVVFIISFLIGTLLGAAGLGLGALTGGG
ncbi:MAG: Yip1 family protein [Anaerolineae bacterium]|nr:YIP1 family protein [Caldilineales bacterium]MDW8267746.1 Yip1 family protein [Anaerolineae bacterium]